MWALPQYMPLVILLRKTMCGHSLVFSSFSSSAAFPFVGGLRASFQAQAEAGAEAGAQAQASGAQTQTEARAEV